MSTSQESLANPPFNDPRADVILQSSDGVHFRVFKIILSFASPIFSDMFSIPLPASRNPDSDDDVPVVTVSENAEALDLSLRHIYPLQTPDTVPLRDAGLLAEFAHKYQVDALEKSVKRYLVDSIEQDPVGVYAIAVAYGYKGVGKSAAQSCLNLPFSRLESQFARCATAEDFAALLRYHVACGEAASTVASERTWFSSLGQSITFMSVGTKAGCGACTAEDFMDLTSNTYSEPMSHNYYPRSVDEASPDRRYGPLCLWSYLHRSALVLARHPAAEAVAADDFILKAIHCASCPPDYRRQMLELGGVFGKEIKKAVELVSMLLYPPFHDDDVCNVQCSI